MKLDFYFDQSQFLRGQPDDAVDEPANTTVSTRPRRDTPIPIRGAQTHVLLRDAKPFQPNFKPKVLSRETDGGFCISVSLEWCGDCVMGRAFNVNDAVYRAISHQRAFIASFRSHMAGIADLETKSLKEQIGVDREITAKYVARYMRVDPIKFTHRKDMKLGQLADSFMALPQGRALLINLMGKTEGHAIAIAHGMSMFRYFDANQGQFSDSVSQGIHGFAESVADNIAKKYSGLQESIDSYEFYRG